MGCAFLTKESLCAGVLKLVDKPDLGSGAARRMGSIPFARTKRALILNWLKVKELELFYFIEVQKNR